MFSKKRLTEGEGFVVGDNIHDNPECRNHYLDVWAVIRPYPTWGEEEGFKKLNQILDIRGY